MTIMTMTSSEYGFPIFISSTDYNLIDLRAELAKYLADLGYRPILSSSDGFHDNSPDLEPWESCLQVLQSAYVMVLVIDGKYGDTFEWKNFESIIGNRKVSPTHAEYLLAHKTKMRMLVFIRKELLTYYQTYRTSIKNSGGNKEKAKEILAATLPKHVAFETLEFIEEVKTARPIPWIKPFENVTEIKQEIQKKMLNELAELFLFKNKHLESVVRAFSTVLDDLPEDKRKETLEKIGATKELIIEIETQTKVISDLKKEKEKLQTQLIEKTDDLDKAQKDKKEEKATLQKKVEKLTKELNSIDTRITSHELNNANYLISGSTMPFATIGSLGNSVNLLGGPINGLYSTDILGNSINPLQISTVFGTGYSGSGYKRCDNCHTDSFSTSSIAFGTLKTCPKCKRNLCSNCFNGLGLSTGYSFSTNTECADCRNKSTNILGTKSPIS